MTQFTLSPTTQNLIKLALSQGPGTSNTNYLNAYNAVYNDIVANGKVNQGTLLWFQQAGLVDTEAFPPGSAQGTFIWNYTKAAALAEGAIITDAELQAASNQIAFTVFTALEKNNFVFDDTTSSTVGFSPADIVNDDAGAGLQVLKDAHPAANLDDAIWGGTLFARTELQDPTYLTDHGISIYPGSRDSFAIVSGAFAGAGATLAASFNSSIISTGLKGGLSIDFPTLGLAVESVAIVAAVVANPVSWSFVLSGVAPSTLSSLALNSTYVVDSATGAALTLVGNGSGGGSAIVYNPTNDTTQITNFVANSGINVPAGSHVTGYSNGTPTDSAASTTGLVASVPMTVANYGAIKATSGYGVWLVANGTVTNGGTSDTTAAITSANSAALVIQGAQGPSAVTNYGSIGGTSGIFDTSASALTVNNLGTVNGGVSADTGSVTNQGAISGFNGVYLGAGGTVTNGSATDTTASITGSNLSITIGAGLLANYAKITGNLQMAGTITNGSASDTAASIAGGINASGVITVGNFGAINGTISMVAAGGNTLTNGSAADTTASIVGGVGTAGSTPSTINNFGSITASGGGSAVVVSQSASVTNGSATDTKALLLGGNSGWGAYVNAGSVINFGTIKGGQGCISLGSGTVTNAGVIASTTPTGTAIQFGSGANKLIEKAGATVSGTIFGGSGSLELANDGTPVTMSSNISVGTLIVDPGTTWSVAARANVPNIVNNGTVAIASGGSLDVSSAVDPSSTGAFQLMTKASLELGAILGSALKIQFLGSGPTNELTIDNASKFGTNVGKASYAGPLLENFVAGDVIDIRGIGSTGLGINYSAASGDLQITGSGGAALATLAFQNSTLGAGTFHAAADPFGGALITHS
jgi:hypothetical protein